MSQEEGFRSRSEEHKRSGSKLIGVSSVLIFVVFAKARLNSAGSLGFITVGEPVMAFLLMTALFLFYLIKTCIYASSESKDNLSALTDGEVRKILEKRIPELEQDYKYDFESLSGYKIGQGVGWGQFVGKYRELRSPSDVLEIFNRGHYEYSIKIDVDPDALSAIERVDQADLSEAIKQFVSLNRRYDISLDSLRSKIKRERRVIYFKFFISPQNFEWVAPFAFSLGAIAAVLCFCIQDKSWMHSVEEVSSAPSFASQQGGQHVGDACVKQQ